MSVFKRYVRRTTERLVIALVWRLPHRVAYWAYIRVMANATTGEWNIEPDRATFSHVAKAWEKRRGGDRAFA